ncbi:MAG TPA: 16S rRNA (guanine(527)-N(7))-methyltransferase RsmG [Candidatus Eisenbergiella intestinipullorum]|nr:16S rRNA (guanine(527)-N(7))-methyltransferase RsmG [Candidatus Eisenbergiella intestinipullorum]
MEYDFEKYDLTSFRQDLGELNIRLSGEQERQFLSFYELLTEWNSFMNLTAITEFDEVVKKHFVDSLSLVKVLPELGKEGASGKAYTLIDVGTGAGFPGIPLKIAFPELEITLLDSLQKRVSFLNAVIEMLSLSKITAVHGRAEDLAKPGKMRERFDFCVSRAVANLSTLSEYCIPFVKKGGSFISYKSAGAEEEAAAAGEAVKILGGAEPEVFSFCLPGTDMGRNFYVIRKKAPTPAKYPRKAGLPAKEPIHG